MQRIIRRLVEWTTERLVYVAGALVVILVCGTFVFLGHESRYALSEQNNYGWRIGLAAADAAAPDLAQDPNASWIGANPEASDGADEKDQAPVLGVAELAGSAQFATGIERGKAGLTRDDLREPKPAEMGDSFRVFGFATPEYRGAKMRLYWQPDMDFIPANSPYSFHLEVGSQGIDLNKTPRGSIEVPTYVAHNDNERQGGFAANITATPGRGAIGSMLRSMTGATWVPSSQYPVYGMLPLILGTLLMAGIAVIFATPIGIGVAIYLAEFAPARLREWLKPFIELLASIPTVVLGYFGLMLVAPAIENTVGKALGMTSGRSLITASVVLAIMILPLIVSLVEDALAAVPRSLRDGAEALGCSQSERTRLVIVPAARAGIVAACLLAACRAIGETMIVWILSGGTAGMPKLNPLQTIAGSTRGIPDTIAIEMGNVDFEGTHYGYLFLLALILFTTTFVLNLIAQRYIRSKSWQTS